MAVQTIGISTAVGTAYSDPGVYYDKRFLERLSPNLYFKDLGQKRPLPQKSGTLVKWRRLDKQTAVTSALTEGTNPTEGSISTTEVTAEPLTYGAFVKMSTELDMKSINPIIEEVNDELSLQAALSYDTLVRNAIHGNLTNQFAGGDANELGTTHVTTAAEFRKAVFKLRNASVPGFEGNLYKALIHPAVEFDVLSESATGSWLDISKYTNAQPALKGEIGMLYGVRIMVSPNVGTGATTAGPLAYRNFIVGSGAFGVTELSGAGVRTIRKDASSGGVANPLEMFSTLGWKFMMASKALQASRGVELYAVTNAA